MIQRYKDGCLGPPRRARTPLALALLVLAATLSPALVAQPPAGDRFPETETLSAERLLGGALETAGGLDTWTAKQTVSFRKRSRRFDEEGSLTSERVESHRYRLQSLAMRIEWHEGDSHFALVNNGEQAIKLVDGHVAEAEADRNQAWNATFGSHYMFSLPFKLSDDGAILSRAGQRRVNGAPADGLQVDYEPGAGSTGGMMTWTYYFDRSRDLVAYFLRFGEGQDDYRWTEYSDPVEVDGLRLPTRRKVYLSNPAGERLALLSEISHEDIRFDVELADPLFEVGN